MDSWLCVRALFTYQLQQLKLIIVIVSWHVYSSMQILQVS